MNIAFVGIEKDWNDLRERDYVNKFVKYHLELPYYYAKYGNNQVWLVTDDPLADDAGCEIQFSNVSYLMTTTVESFKRDKRKFDVVIHWRKWIEDCYRSEAVNVINSQDHTYSVEWMNTIEMASLQGKLYGILCFPTWHERNLKSELTRAGLTLETGFTREPRLLPGVTLGVDTDVYMPSQNKRRQSLLWASDPGRGLMGAVEVATKVFQFDKRTKLHVCWPDYYAGDMNIPHPAIEFHRNLDNGPTLWTLFNGSGFLPYTSTFMEPSSRAHRQAMAAGCVVLYPPGMGTPSDLLTDGHDAIVRPVSEWPEIISGLIHDENEFERISKNAREHAVRENWNVQANRFNELFEEIINGR